MSTAIANVPLRRIDGTTASLADYEGQVLLVVNVASKCGFTPQYEKLERLYQTYSSRGFTIFGFPANDFGQQEPGSNTEIAQFCSSQYGVSFPVFEKTTVLGSQKHPLYAGLIAAQPTPTTPTHDLRQHLIEFGVQPTSEPEVLWNFEKFLIDRSGRPVARFASDVEPDDAAMMDRIEAELKK